MSSFKLHRGDIPIIVSAPHSQKCVRDGNEKNNEVMTGEIALYISKSLGCHCIVKTSTTGYDPNYDYGNPYQERLSRYVSENGIKVLIDLHGCSEDNDFSIDIGTAGKKIKHILRETLPSYSIIGLPVTYNRKYKAEESDTITKYVSENNSGCICLQLEVNRLLRDGDNMKNVRELVRFLSHFILNMENFVENQ